MQDKNKDITPYNNKGLSHGKWVMYHEDNTTKAHCFFVNAIPKGYLYSNLNYLPMLKVYYAR